MREDHIQMVKEIIKSVIKNNIGLVHAIYYSYSRMTPNGINIFASGAGDNTKLYTGLEGACILSHCFLPNCLPIK